MDKTYPPFDLGFITGISNILAKTNYPGLTNKEIEETFARCKVLSIESGANKRESIKNTLDSTQNQNNAGDILIKFITEAMNPCLYTKNVERWKKLQKELNEVLAQYALEINDSGSVIERDQAITSLDDIAKMTSDLQSELKRRGCHEILFQYCHEELIAKSLFHSISEAAKSISDRIRELTGFTEDGAVLFTKVFGSKNQEPILLINSLSNESDISEQKGFYNLLVGIHGHFRNPRAHNTRLNSNESKENFYDAFALFSYVHRRLDKVILKK